MTTGTRDTGRAALRRTVGEQARPSDAVIGTAAALASMAEATEEDPAVLVFFDGLADARELAVWGAWRRDRD